MYVTKDAKVQLPVLGPLALHFLRTDQRSILDSIDASQQNMFAKTLSVMRAGNANAIFPNSTFKDNFDFKRDYFNQFGRFIPYDFVNQVIPVIFKATGSETLDVFPTHYVAGTVELMNVNLLFNNIVGERSTQLNQVYFNVTPSP